MTQHEFVKAVNQQFNLRSLLAAMGHQVDRIPTTLRCPFHEDNSKSAKLFEDNKLWCWACHKMFGAYDALLLMGVSESEIKRKLSQMGAISLAPEKSFTVDVEKAKKLRADFRLGKIPLRRLLDDLYLLMLEGEAQA